MKYIITFIVSILVSNNIVIRGNDKVYEIVMDFYGWYIDAIHNLPDKEYQPYVEYNDTTKTYSLKTELYCQNLRKHYFSENLIQRELSNYKECSENLQKAKKVPFEDIDDYDNIGCGFVLNYRWLNNDQEAVDGVKIEEIKNIEKDHFSVLCKYYFEDGETKKITYQNYICYVTVIKSNGKYEIDNFEFKMDNN